MATMPSVSIDDDVVVAAWPGGWPGPDKTGDRRRWPDAFVSVTNIHDIVNAAGIDPDLAAAVTAALDAYLDAVTTPVSPHHYAYEWALANILDAAIDEQDRRNDKPVTFVRVQP